jgi:hypothetical protein
VSHASFVMAITIPATTNTTIATCIHNQWRGILYHASGSAAGRPGRASCRGDQTYGMMPGWPARLAIPTARRF